MLFWRPRLGLAYLFVGLSFFLLHAIQTTDTPGKLLASRLGERSRAVMVTGSVVGEAKVGSSGVASFLFKLTSLELEGKAERSEATILVRWRALPEFGDQLQLFGDLAPIAPPRNPGEFDLRAYLSRQDVLRILQVRYQEDGVVLRHGGGNPVLRIAQRSRAWLQQVICRGLDDSPEVEEFINGITLGLRHQGAEDIEEPFQQTGTLHLFAVAGLHVGIVARLLWMLAQVARLSRKWAVALIIPLLLLYSAVTGLHVSSLRAAVMTAVLLGGLVFDRRVFTLNTVAAAATVLLCWNTNDLFSTGFQLSFCVVGTIVMLGDPMANWFRRRTGADPFLPRTLQTRSQLAADKVLRWLGQGVAVSMAAWIGSVVLLFWYFHLVTPVSLLANLIVVPIAFFILATALLSVVSAPLLPSLSIVFNNANWLLAQIVLAVVHFFSQCPGGHLYLAHPPWMGSSVAQLDVLDLGSGAAVHLRTSAGDWLFDCGSQKDYDHVVRDYLHATGVNRLNGLLLTHGDSLHIGGAAPLLEDITPSRLVDNSANDRSSVHKRLRRLFEQRQLIAETPGRGDAFFIAPRIECRVFHPPRGFSAALADDEVLVVQLTVGKNARILLMSDSGIATEQALLQTGIDLHSDILIKGQHRSGESGSDPFLEAVRPRLVIATSRDFPQRERVDDQWAARLRTHQIKLFRQDESGAVELHFQNDRWTARSYVTGELFEVRSDGSENPQP